MASNNYRSLGTFPFQAFANNYNDKVASSEIPNAYGVSAALVSEINSATTAFDSSVTAFTNAETAYHASVAARDTSRDALTAKIAEANAMIYANPAVTPAMLADAGLAIHSTGSSPIVPQPPVELSAFGCQNGNTLKWGRNGNAGSVVFAIERQIAGGAWTQVGMTRRSSFDDTTATPGAACQYRVYAFNDGLQSIASNIAGVFTGDLPVELEVAA